jgi:uncharacterized membrane protein YhfC
MDITFLIIQGIITLLSFLIGAFVYHRGLTDQAPLSLDLNSQEPEPEADWDQL